MEKRKTDHSAHRCYILVLSGLFSKKKISRPPPVYIASLCVLLIECVNKFEKDVSCFRGSNPLKSKV